MIADINSGTLWVLFGWCLPLIVIGIGVAIYGTRRQKRFDRLEDALYRQTHELPGE